MVHGPAAMAENINRKKSYRNFGVKMEGIKKDRGRKGIQEPKQEGSFFTFPEFSREQKNLESQ